MFKDSRRTQLLAIRRSLQTRRKRQRRLLVENLEARTLMASDTFSDPTDLRIGVSLLADPWSWQAGNAPGSGSGSGSGSGVGGIPLSDTFKLHSRPTATKTIYMDFDGFTAKLTPWKPNGDLVSPPFDLDGNPSSFSDDELLNIQKAWQAVAADFAPFDINVTTEDPGEADLVNTGGSDDRWGIRAVITTDDEPARGTGGVAFFGSFRWGYNKPGASDTPCYVFNRWEGSMAQTVSHEVGHSLDLNHDGNPGVEYYPGHGSGETSWGTIMGAGFGRNLTTWSNGAYFNSSNKEDDLSIITSDANGFGFIADEFGDTRGTSSELTGPMNAFDRNVISQFGRIEKSNDLDFFRFQVGSGLFDLTIDPYITQVNSKKADGSFATSIESSQFLEGTNMDIEAKLMDESGNVIATSNPADSMKAQFNLDLSPGIYYLSVDGVGFGNPMADPPEGYTDYGSLGQYLVSGSFPVAFGVAVSSSVLTFTENEAPKPITDSAKVIDNFPGTYASGALVVSMTPASGATDFISLDFLSSPDLVQTGSLITFRSVPVGNISKLSETAFRVDFTSSATKEAIEEIVKIIRFEARGDSPDTFDRSIQITLNKGSARGATNIQLNVISVNDRPLALIAPMNEINEDDGNSPGTKVEVLIDRGTVDFDATKSKAIVLTGVPISPGKWQYDVGRGWTDLGPVSATNGLVLGPTAGLRFVPSKDFFGAVPPLRFLALDPLYVGAVSSASRLVFINTQTVMAPDSISAISGEIRQNVRPVNDPPVASEPYPSTSVLQDKPLRYTLPANLFSDVDDNVSSLRLSALTGPGVPLPAWLSFDPDSRTLMGTPSNKDVGLRQFIVRATDPSGAFGDAPLTIDIINVNDAPISIQLVGKPVPENVFGAFIGKLTTIDPDPMDSISLSIVDNPSNRFEIRGTELFLSGLSSFDFETARSEKVTIRATDNGSPRLFLDKEITIEVQDVNEFPPNLRPMSFSVSESASTGTEVGKVIATDGDSANVLRYRFFGAVPAQFDISEDGKLTVKNNANLDFETVPNIQFFVQAYDDGMPSLSTWASVTVSVVNANEHAPDCVTNSLVISENYPIGVPVGRIIATDRDNQSVIFSLLPTETRFSINPTTGELSLNQPGLFDYELSRSDSVTVIVTDIGLPGPSRSTQKVIAISIANANEPPTKVYLEDDHDQVLANISGAAIGRILVEDPDGPTNYSITALDDRFEVIDGILRLRSGRSLTDSDAQFLSVPLLLNDLSGSISHRATVQVERILNPKPWTNPDNPMDVDHDGDVGPLDVLAVVNAINSGASELPIPRTSVSLILADLDVDGNGQVNPLDVLAIVNIINGNPNPSPEGEGEGSRASSSVSVDDFFAQYDSETDPVISRSRRTARLRNG